MPENKEKTLLDVAYDIRKEHAKAQQTPSEGPDPPNDPEPIEDQETDDTIDSPDPSPSIKPILRQHVTFASVAAHL